jgi:hypothetical protein
MLQSHQEQDRRRGGQVPRGCVGREQAHISQVSYIFSAFTMASFTLTLFRFYYGVWFGLKIELATVQHKSFVIMYKE